jgi:DNA-binding MarR family transcriptional regulator
MRLAGTVRAKGRRESAPGGQVTWCKPAREGLTLPRAHVLWLLHHNGPSTQRALADALKVTPRNVTGLVDGLTASGHVTREPHPGDRRATLVTLTDHAAATMAGMHAGHGRLAELLFGGMPHFEAFAEGLDHVTGRLREGGPPRERGPTAAG